MTDCYKLIPSTKEYSKLSTKIRDVNNTRKNLTENEIYFNPKSISISNIQHEISTNNYLVGKHKSHVQYLWDFNRNSKKQVIPSVYTRNFTTILEDMVFQTDDFFVVITSENIAFLISPENDNKLTKIKDNASYCITNGVSMLFYNIDDSISVYNPYTKFLETFNNIDVGVVYTTYNSFFIKTIDDRLWGYDSVVDDAGYISSLDGIVSKVVTTYDTATVITTSGRLWITGNTNNGADLPQDDDRFVIGIYNCINVVRSHRAGAVITSDRRVWAWGDTDFGGSPEPNYVHDLVEVIDIESIFGCIYAIDINGDFYAWGGKWLKTYNKYDTFAIAEKITGINTENIIKRYHNKFAYAILLRNGNVFTFGDYVNKGFVKNVKNVKDVTSNIKSFAIRTSLGRVYVMGCAEHGGKNEVGEEGFLNVININKVYGAYGMYFATSVKIVSNNVQELIYTWGKYKNPILNFNNMYWGTTTKLYTFSVDGSIIVVGIDNEMIKDGKIVDKQGVNCTISDVNTVASNKHNVITIFDCESVMVDTEGVATDAIANANNTIAIAKKQDTKSVVWQPFVVLIVFIIILIIVVYLSR